MVLQIGLRGLGQCERPHNNSLLSQKGEVVVHCGAGHSGMAMLEH